MSVQSEITRIANAKTALATAIEGKGVTVPEGTKLDGMAALVESIEAGGGGNFAWGTFATTDDITSNIVLTHNLGVKPNYFFMHLITDANTNYVVKLVSVVKLIGGRISLRYNKPGNSALSNSIANTDENSGTASTGLFYYINYDETTFTLKQVNFSNTYGIGANFEFFWMAFGGSVI